MNLEDTEYKRELTEGCPKDFEVEKVSHLCGGV